MTPKLFTKTVQSYKFSHNLIVKYFSGVLLTQIEEVSHSFLISEAHSNFDQTSKMEHFVKIVNG